VESPLRFRRHAVVVGVVPGVVVVGAAGRAVKGVDLSFRASVLPVAQLVVAAVVVVDRAVVVAKVVKVSLG
jgi:hypothetical protein